MKHKIKSSAPALEKGIRILQRLAETGQQNLEALSNDLGEPKASVLRYLDTLLLLDLVDRNPVTKEYSAKVAMISLESAEKELSSKVQKLLELLAAKSGRTAEWYVMRGGICC